MDGAFGWGQLLLQRDVTEGLLVLCEVVSDYIPESLGLLWAEVDALEVLDVDLVRGLLGHRAEDEQEVPDAHADLNAVGVAVAVAVGLGELQLGLLGRRILLTHGIAFCCCCVRILVRKGGLEPPWIAPPDPKSGASANFATFALI
jgi:hypothetical protein